MDYKLYYWAIPFRGDFIRLLLEDAAMKYEEGTSEEIVELKSMSVGEQPLPSMAPPFLKDYDNGVFLNQMPTILMYLAEKLDYLPKDPYQSAVCLKLILDSNDVLAEITNLNGSMMWEYDKWKAFRTNRLKRWFEIFEETGKQFGLNKDGAYFLGGERISVADIIVFGLWGTMTRCLPELSVDFEKHAPKLFSLCRRIGDRPQIRDFVKRQRQKSGNLYCAGQIEKSIRSMLDKDSQA